MKFTHTHVTPTEAATQVCRSQFIARIDEVQKSNHRKYDEPEVENQVHLFVVEVRHQSTLHLASVRLPEIVVRKLAVGSPRKIAGGIP